MNQCIGQCNGIMTSNTELWYYDVKYGKHSLERNASMGGTGPCTVKYEARVELIQRLNLTSNHENYDLEVPDFERL